MQEKNTILQPCPFCGSNRIESNCYIRDGRSVNCLDCGASVHAYHPQANERSVEKWNTRVAVAVLTTADIERI